MSKQAKGMLLLALGLLAAQGHADLSPTAAAQTEAAPAAQTNVSADDAFNFFLQEAQVVTASRRAQKKSDSPVAIDVITHEEIEKSGARSVPDLLRFRVGVDVVEGNSIQGNSSMVNLRGIPAELSQSLQVLVDGRSVISLSTSGIDWRTLPVTLDDIERIEIVRGPNSALFGANSGQGVINIITKKPGSGASSARAEAGTLGKKLDNISLDTGNETLAVRGSYQESVHGSNLTPQGDLPAATLGDQTTHDSRSNLRAIGKFWQGGELDLSAGRVDADYTYPGAYGVTGDTVADKDFQMLKLTQTLSDRFSLEAMAARRRDSQQAYFAGTETVYDGDLLLRASLMDGKSQTVLGTSYRYGEALFPAYFSDSPQADPTLYAYSRNSDEITAYQHQTRAYLSEQMEVLDWLSVALAGSYEGSDTGGQQAAYQGAFIVKPADEVSLRLSGSHSPTTPSLQNKFARVELAVPVSPGVLYVNRVEGTNINSPQVSSYEATLDWGLLDRRVSLELTGFQMEIEGYPDFVTGPSVNIFTTSPFKTGTLSYYGNVHSLVLRGTETTLTFKPMLGTLIQLNHTYEDVQSAKITSLYAYTTPWNKVNLTASTDLPWGFNLGGGINWQGQHNSYLASRTTVLFVPDQAKIDLRVGYKPLKNVELYAAGLNLDHAFRTESTDGLTQDQSYVGGVNITWGGSSK